MRMSSGLPTVLLEFEQVPYCSISILSIVVQWMDSSLSLRSSVFWNFDAYVTYFPVLVMFISSS